MILAAAAQAIGRNKMRSALTMLGVFIGVAALIVMVAVGNGASEAVRKQIESLGTNVVVVLPGALTTGGIRAGFGSASTLTVADARAIRREDPAVAQVGYLIRQIGAGAIQQSELDDDDPGREPELPADHQLADRRRARHHGRGRKQGQPRRRHRANGVPPAVQSRRESDRRLHPGQERAAAGDRRPRSPRASRSSAPIRTIWS